MECEVPELQLPGNLETYFFFLVTCFSIFVQSLRAAEVPIRRDRSHGGVALMTFFSPFVFVVSCGRDG